MASAPEIRTRFVTGHGFSRAAIGPKTRWALAPAKLLTEGAGGFNPRIDAQIERGLQARTTASMPSTTGVPGSAEKVEALEKTFRGDRQRVGEWTTQQALYLIRRRLR